MRPGRGRGRRHRSLGPQSSGVINCSTHSRRRDLVQGRRVSTGSPARFPHLLPKGGLNPALNSEVLAEARIYYAAWAGGEGFISNTVIG
jgi:hypothetical protein